MYVSNLASVVTIVTQNYMKLISALILILILFTILNAAWIGDDAQITFRQVWNLISGLGITFNYAERVQAFTHPLWFWVLSFVGYITQELFLTTIIVSTIFSMLSVILLMKIEFNEARNNRTLISPVILLIFSWAFCDYTTSGLENSLSFLLTGILIYILSQNQWEQKLREIFLILSMLVLNRIDYSVLFLPIVAYLVWNCRNLKLLFHAIWPGALLMLAWFIFATIYFGSPFPNTYYAKLNAGFPTEEVLLRGWIYFLAMGDDLASLFIMLSALVLTLISRNTFLMCLSLGQFLYCLYILQAGGDFMLGRYFAILVYISIGQIIISLTLLKNVKLITKNLIVIGLFATLLVIGIFDRYPFRSHIDGDTRRPDLGTLDPITHIADERSFYHYIFGLFSDSRNTWPRIVDQKDQFPTDYRTGCGIMGGNALEDPNIFIIDLCGLTDPFISKLPAIQVDSWRIGHHFRKMPINYGEFKLGRIESLDDPNLTKLAKDIQLISSGKLTDINRLKAIWRLNTGFYTGLDLAEYKSPSIFIPFSSKTEIVQLEDWDSELESESLAPIYGDFTYKYFATNIKFQSIKPRISDEIEIFVNSEFAYEVYVNDKYVTIIDKIVQDRIFGGYNRNTIIPLQKRTKVSSIELRAIDASYINDTSANVVFQIKVNESLNLSQLRNQTENHRHSWVNEINSEYASQLEVAWAFSTGSLLGRQDAPLDLNDIKYAYTPYSNRNNASNFRENRQILWKYKSKRNSGILSNLNERKEYLGLSYREDKIFLNQSDNTLVALDAFTDNLVWKINANKPNEISNS